MWQIKNVLISNCPICGLLWSEPIDEEEVRHSFWICDRCGCEHGYDDTSNYREQWLRKGALWFDEKQRPKDWNLEDQLRHILPGWNAGDSRQLR